MDIFDKIGDALATTGKEVANLAKDVTESTRLNVKLKEEELSQSKLFYKLGKLFYENEQDCPDEKYAEIWKALEKSDAKIARYKEEISISKGVRVCPFCGAKYPQNSAECPTCGKVNSDVK